MAKPSRPPSWPSWAEVFSRVKPREPMRISAIIVAAGSSRRMGFDKLGADLGGETVLVRSMLAMASCPEVVELRVVTNSDRIEEVTKSARRLGIASFVEALPGGAERHLSVAAGLERVGLDCDLVAVHDAARPLVTAEAIQRCAEMAFSHGGASLAHRVVDTLKRADESGEVCEAVSRENLWAMETPQIFRTDLLREAYATVLSQGALVTDEVSALTAIGQRVLLVENTTPNLKITVAGDLALARKCWESARATC